MAVEFTKSEVFDLVKAFIGVTLIFWWVSGGMKILVLLPIIAIIVGFAFILHELAHKLMASYYGYRAHFMSNDSFILVSIFLGFFGVIFLAPGAVMVEQVRKLKHLGIISIVGPLTNVVLALLSVALIPVFGPLAKFGFQINSMLALFNMLPLMGLDGEKVLAWNKPVYFVFASVVVIIYLTSYLI